jgi:hypothetical protein
MALLICQVALGRSQKSKAMQRGLGGFHASSYNGGNLRNGLAPHERLHQEVKSQEFNLLPA